MRFLCKVSRESKPNFETCESRNASTHKWKALRDVMWLKATHPARAILLVPFPWCTVSAELQFIAFDMLVENIATWNIVYSGKIKLVSGWVSLNPVKLKTFECRGPHNVEIKRLASVSRLFTVPLFFALKIVALSRSIVEPPSWIIWRAKTGEKTKLPWVRAAGRGEASPPTPLPTGILFSPQLSLVTRNQDGGAVTKSLWQRCELYDRPLQQHGKIGDCEQSTSVSCWISRFRNARARRHLKCNWNKLIARLTLQQKNIYWPIFRLAVAELVFLRALALAIMKENNGSLSVPSSSYSSKRIKRTLPLPSLSPFPSLPLFLLLSHPISLPLSPFPTSLLHCLRYTPVVSHLV